MSNTKFSNILLDTSPKKINKFSEDILDTLFTLNEFVRELNSIDFCNPLGYILTKALPPGGEVDKILKGYGTKVSKWVDNSTSKLELTNTSLLSESIETLRLSLEEIIPPEEIKTIIPGGDGIMKTIQTLNDSLVITNTVISLSDKKRLLKSFTDRLIPLSNPISITELLLKNSSEKLNEKLSNFIKPERFKHGLLKLIKLVIKIDKSIASIKSIVILMNKIIKTINSLIKIYKISISIFKMMPMPAKFVTVGMTVTSSSKVSKISNDISDLEKILDSASKFLSTTIVFQVNKIRNEIFILLIGLNQLYENLNQCNSFKDNIITSEIKNSISNLENNIVVLNELFPNNELKIDSDGGVGEYKGYNIDIYKEQVTDNNTSLIRKRVVVTNNVNIIEYEGKPTYSNKIQLLIKEAQFYIDSKGEVNTYDRKNNSITDEDTKAILKSIGMDSNTLEESSRKEKEIKNILKEQISNNPTDKKLYENPILSESRSLESRGSQVYKIIKILKVNYTNPILFRNRLQRMKASLISQGYTLDDIQQGIKMSENSDYSLK